MDSERWEQVNVPKSLMEVVSKRIKDTGSMWTNKSEFVRDAIRDMLRKGKDYIYKFPFSDLKSC